MFQDGNKRIANLVANKEMIKNGLGILNVPVELIGKYFTYLINYYETGDNKELKQFIYDNCLDGLNNDKKGENMEEILMNAEMEMGTAIENMEKRFLNIRAGRANPAMLDGVMVSYYGVDTPLKQLATISIPEARQLCIKPFDRSCISAIEKGIYEANIGLTPNNNGEMIILNIPALTEETRRGYVKQAKEYAEDCKIVLRNIRQDANNSIKKLELPEDDVKNGQDEVQELINKYNKVVEEKLKVKETELMTV